MAETVVVESFSLDFRTYGSGTGPKVLVTAGIHGGEASGIFAARKLMGWLEGRDLKGSVTVLPVANPVAFRNGTRSSPYDDMDLNRIFPGRPTGCASELVAHTIFARAMQADFIVDLHCCGLFGSDYTLALWQEFPFARDLAAKLDIPVVIQSGGTRSQLFVEACHRGIPAVIIELAGGQLGSAGGYVNRRSGENAFRAVSNLLMRLGVAEGAAPPVEPEFFGKLQEVCAHKAALWTPVIGPRSRFQAGEVLGDLDGEPVRAPIAGLATSVRGDSYVFPGHLLTMAAPMA